MKIKNKTNKSNFLKKIFIKLSRIFGFEIIDRGRRLSGPFGDELIAGGYIQRFSIFSTSKNSEIF